jgi:hypothetical protein
LLERKGDFSLKRLPKKRTGFIYIMQAGQWYKIGRTRDLHERLRLLGTIPPFPASILHAFGCQDTYAAEGYLHRLFASKRVRGEWFLLEGADLALILTIHGFHGNEPSIRPPEHNYDVYGDGVETARAGQPPSANPFDPAYPCYEIWRTGYNDWLRCLMVGGNFHGRTVESIIERVGVQPLLEAASEGQTDDGWIKHLPAMVYISLARHWPVPEDGPELAGREPDHA